MQISVTIVVIIFENRYFTLFVDEMEEVAYLSKHQIVYDSDIINYFFPDHLQMQINEDFDNKFGRTSSQDEYYASKKIAWKLKEKTS